MEIRILRKVKVSFLTLKYALKKQNYRIVRETMNVYQSEGIDAPVSSDIGINNGNSLFAFDIDSINRSMKMTTLFKCVFSKKRCRMST